MGYFDKLYSIATDLISVTYSFAPKSSGYRNNRLLKLSEREVYKAKVSFDPSDCKSISIDSLNVQDQKKFKDMISKNTSNQEFVA